MKRIWKALVLSATIAACLALPASASAHCANPSGWVRTMSHTSNQWLTAWSLDGTHTGLVYANEWVYGHAYDATWAHAWGTFWMWSNGAWSKHTGWHWMRTTDIVC